MIECVNAVEQVLLSEKLEQNYDYTVPHCICVDRKKINIRLFWMKNIVFVTMRTDMIHRGKTGSA